MHMQRLHTHTLVDEQPLTDVHHPDFLLNLHTAVFSMMVNWLVDSEDGLLSNSSQIESLVLLKLILGFSS